MRIVRNKMFCKKLEVPARLNRLFLLGVMFLLLFFPVSLQAQQKHALLIGISDYPQYDAPNASWTQIHGSNDVQLVSPILAKQGFSIIALTDKSATHQAIEDNFKKLEMSVNSGDIVYIHLSGHGQAVEDESGDEEDGWDESFVPYDARQCYQEKDYHGENHLLDDELNENLNLIRKKVGKSGMVYVVIDACHAGSSYRGDELEENVFVRGTEMGFSRDGKSYVPRIDRRGNIRFSAENELSPVYMLEACRSYEVNAEIMQDGQYYGPLSYYISQQLLTTPLSFDTTWIEEVRKNMNKDIRLVRQNMVTESSK